MLDGDQDRVATGIEGRYQPKPMLRAEERVDADVQPVTASELTIAAAAAMQAPWVQALLSPSAWRSGLLAAWGELVEVSV